MNTDNYYILLPVYDDWTSLYRLLEAMKGCAGSALFARLRFVVVDDASNVDFDPLAFEGYPVRVLHLHRNMGHQRAIAIGLSYIVAEIADAAAVIVMDADGEDTPEGVLNLIAAHEHDKGSIIFASRGRRQNNLMFQIAYRCYRALFTMLTGSRISFGNFSLVPIHHVKRLVYVPEIWSHYPGGVMRSRIPYLTVPVNRGKRYHGRSRMNPVSLILHGLGSIAVHLETVAVRLLLFFLSLLILAAIGILTVIYLKIFTSMAIPGWATSAFSGLTLIFMQALLISLFLVFIILNYRTQKQIIPANEFKDYISGLD